MGNQCCSEPLDDPMNVDQNVDSVQEPLDPLNVSRAQSRVRRNQQIVVEEIKRKQLSPQKMDSSPVPSSFNQPEEPEEPHEPSLSAPQLEPHGEEEEDENDMSTHGIDLVVKEEYVYENGIVYSGQMRQVFLPDSDEPTWIKQGKGTQVWPDKAKYEGEWVDDVAQGYGIFYHANGDVYRGQFEKDKATGFGKYIHFDGQTYEGWWKDDKQNGSGKATFPDGSSFEGEYRDGKKWGKGAYKWANGSEFAGDWVNNEIQGFGEYIWEEGRSYKGEWKDSLMHGKGIYKWPDGRIYDGEFVNDKKHGYGVLTWADGRMYDGYWKDGAQHGKATFTNASGKSKIGVWENGKRLQWEGRSSVAAMREEDELKVFEKNRATTTNAMIRKSRVEEQPTQ